MLLDSFYILEYKRGWDTAFIKELIIWADSAVRLHITTDEPTPKPIPPPLVGELFQENTPRTRVFFHLEYYPANIPRRVLSNIYDTRCCAVFESIGIKTFTITYSRPPNLQQALTRAQLHQADGKGARHFYSHTPALD